MTEAYAKPEKISKTELLVTIFKKAINNLTKSPTSDSTDILDR